MTRRARVGTRGDDAVALHVARALRTMSIARACPATSRRVAFVSPRAIARGPVPVPLVCGATVVTDATRAPRTDSIRRVLPAGDVERRQLSSEASTAGRSRSALARVGRRDARSATIAAASVDPGESSTSSSSSSEDADDSGGLDARIWALALPAVASLLLDPVLGAVDTAFVGRIEGDGAAAALGGLAVSTTVFNFSFKLFNFLAVVTGPLVAAQIAAARKTAAEASPSDGSDPTDARTAAAETVTGAMTLAIVLGVSACVALEAGADPILSWAGGDAAAKRDPVGAVGVGVVEVVDLPGDGPMPALTGDGSYPTSAPVESALMSEAEAYLRVRALSAPAALIGTVSVGAYRGLLDTRTPLLVSGAAQLVNLALDPILIFGLGPIPAFGVAGAAAATTAAEWGSAVAFWALLTREGLLPREGLLSSSSSSDESSSSSDERSDISSSSSSAPSGVSEWARRLRPLAAGSASQLARTLILQAVLVRATAEAAGAGAAGAHQICIQVWWVTLFALDALAVAAQSLVADALGAGDVFTARRAADRTLRWALAAGVAVGVGIAAAGPIVPALFTSDSNTAAAAEGPLRLVAALQPLNAAVFVGDGVLQGAADFDYLAIAMAAAAAPALISLAAVGTGGGGEAVEGTAGLMGATGLAGVWRSMAALQVGRAATLAARYWSEDGPVSLRRDEASANDADDAEDAEDA